MKKWLPAIRSVLAITIMLLGFGMVIKASTLNSASQEFEQDVVSARSFDTGDSIILGSRAEVQLIPIEGQSVSLYSESSPTSIEKLILSESTEVMSGEWFLDGSGTLIINPYGQASFNDKSQKEARNKEFEKTMIWFMILFSVFLVYSILFTWARPIADQESGIVSTT